MKILNLYTRTIVPLLLLVGGFTGVLAQSPNGQAYPNPTTQPLKATPSAYNSNIPLNTVRVWQASKPLQHDTAISSKYTAVSDVQRMTQYFDGMGRPLQTVSKGITPGGKDMVTPAWYDEVGNESYKYLPYVSPSSDGNFKLNPFNEQNTFLKTVHNPASNADGEKFFYSRTDYEASPLNRVAKVYAPGNSWTGSGAGTNTQYLVNVIADSVRIWNINAAGSTPVSTGFYAAGQLFKNVSTDENGYDVVEYKDKSGNIILKKVEMITASSAGPTGWYNTYYVYDDLQNLRYVIQPKGTDWLKANSWTFDNTLWQNSTIARELCFSYEYDGRKRMVVKRVPGTGEIWQVYDARDRLVMVQDSVNRAQGRWMFTKYDSLNRVVLTGLWSTTGDRAYHQNLARASSSYPSPAAGAYTLLSETYYDNYNWVSGSGSGLSSALITGNGITGTAFFYAASNTGFPYPQAIATGTAKGLVTGVKTAIPGTATYLYVVNFYDNRGRLIQTHSTNFSGGRDTLTTQYSFSGQVLRTLECHQKAGDNAQSYRMLTKMEYDAGGRHIRTYKKAGNSPEIVIAENKYDELGQLVRKNVGKVRNSSSQNTYTNTPLDSLKYDYNIRGWMRGINKAYARAESGGTGWFGMELNYDFGFTNTELAGNVAGVRWRSKGDDDQRAYGFTYDAANRLTRANFTQYTGSAWNVSAGVDYSVPTITYDQNGNIIKMQQKGQVLTSSPTIDSLDYGYFTNSNRLSYVNDKTNNVNSRLGDFKEITSNTTQDYWYDGNGNLTKDNNKNISFIRYNHLNLPDSIAITGKGYIRYIYDAAGNKLRKITVDNAAGKTSRTDYLGSFVYLNDTLQFALQEEGRVRPKRANYSDTMYYDYFEKDYLGNVRVVLTDELQQNIYPAATLEGSISTDGSPNAIYKEKDYYTINPANVVDKSLATGITDYQNNNGNPPPNNNPNSNVTANSQKLYKLIATTTGGVTGLGMTLKVMGGDRIDILGKSYFFESNTAGANYNVPVLDIFTGLLGAPGGAASKGFTAGQLNSGAIASAVSGFLTDPDRNNGATTVPKAYINYILFDENFKYIAGNFSRVGAANTVKSHYADAQLQNIPVTKNGYLYVYVSNESPVNVFFDNLQVVHTRGPLVEETHYYPFGLVQQGISSKAFNSNYAVNKILHSSKELQNQEFTDGSGLDLYDYGARFYDVQTGRWHKTDNKAELYFATSPYVYALNQPTNAIDPDGNLVIFINGNHFGEKGHKYWTAKNYYTTTGKVGQPAPQGYRTINGRGTTILYGKDRFFDYEVMAQLKDQHTPRYYDGSGGGWHPLGDGTIEYPGRQSATAAGREQMGYEKGKEDAAEIIANLERDKNGNIVETIKIVTHSMGGAYGKGFVRALREYIQTLPAAQQQQVKIEQVVDFDPYQGADITADGQTPTFQFIHYGLLANQKEKGNVEQKKSKSSSNAHSIFSFFPDISQLQPGTYKWNPQTRTWDLQP